MGTVRKRPARRKGAKTGEVRWQARWRDPDGVQRAKNFRRRVDAEDHLLAMEGSKRTGGYIDPDRSKVTVRDLADEWIGTRTSWKPSTIESARSHFDNHINPAIGHRPVGAVTHGELQALIAKLSRSGLAPSTVGVIHTRLTSLFKYAIKDQRISHNPALGLDVPSVQRTKVERGEVLTDDEVERLAGAVPSRLEVMVWVMAHTGIRAAEAAGLCVDALDLDAAVLHVRRQLHTPSAGPTRLASPKTSASERTIPLAPGTVTRLREHLTRFEPCPIDDGGALRHLVFASRTSGPLRRSSMGSIWTRAAKVADLPDHATGWHALRHYFASKLIASGQSVKTVQSLLGHTSAVTTLDVYSHLWPGSDDDVRSAVAAIGG